MKGPAMLLDTVQSFVDETPGARGLPRVAQAMEMVESLKEAKAQGSDISVLVDSMLSMVRDDIIAKIKADHVNTQTELDSKKNDAVTAAGDATAKKTTADSKFGAMNTCHSEEKTDLGQHETKVSDTAAATTARNTAKSDAEIAANINSEIGASTFVCDASEDVDCATATAVFNAAVDSQVQAWEGDVQSQINNFNEKNQTWTTKESELAVDVGEELTAHNTYVAKRQTCDTEMADKGTAVCVYAEHESTACTKQTEYATLVVEVQGGNSVYSDSDRQTEFSTSALVECLLTQLKDEAQNCDGTFPMSAEVTPLTYPATAGTCVQSGITFAAKVWTRPPLNADGTFPSSLAYEEADTVAVSLTDLLGDCEGDEDKDE